MPKRTGHHKAEFKHRRGARSEGSWAQQRRKHEAGTRAQVCPTRESLLFSRRCYLHDAAEEGGGVHFLSSRTPSPRPSSQARICAHRSKLQHDPPRAGGSQADLCSGMRSLLFAGFQTSEPLALTKPVLLPPRRRDPHCKRSTKRILFCSTKIYESSYLRHQLKYWY